MWGAGEIGELNLEELNNSLEKRHSLSACWAAAWQARGLKSANVVFFEIAPT